MSINHKLLAMKHLALALEKNRDYWRERCIRQREALEQLSKMLLDSDKTSDEILEILECATVIDRVGEESEDDESSFLEEVDSDIS